MNQTEFATQISCKIAAIMAKELQATHVTHNFTNNLLMQLNVIHNKNPHLTLLQAMAVMYAEDAQANLFTVAFEELQGSGKELLGITFTNVAGAPKVTAILIGNPP